MPHRGSGTERLARRPSRIPLANRFGAFFILDAPNRQDRQADAARDQLAIGGGAERPADAFSRARRHSSRVRWLKIGLPLIASAIVLAGAVAVWLARSLPADIAFASTSIEDGRLVMRDPRMSGVDGNDRPFSMVASRAIQALGGSSIDLEGVRANLTVDEGTTAELVAAKGRFDTRTNVLRLYDQISVDTTSGIRIRMQSADVALEGGTLTGTGPVEIATADQRLEAGNVSISDGGKTLSFGNRVKLTLLPQSLSNGGAAPTSEPGP